FGLSRDAFDSMLTVFGSMLPEDHILPKIMYQATKILSALKMPYEQIHSCPNGFILFRKEHEAETYCPKCKASRFLEVDAGDGQPKRQLTIPMKIVRHLGAGSGVALIFLVLGMTFLIRELKERRKKNLREKFFKQNRGQLL